MNRRHDIDALRAIAFGLLIAYHLAMFYVADWRWHIKSEHLSEFLQVPMLFVNRWRMDLIFMISGISAAFMWKSDRVLAFFKQRSKRLLLPLLFGCLVVVPVQPYCQGVTNGLVEPGFVQFLYRYYVGYEWPKGAFDGWKHSFTWNHLWYLVYLYLYTVVLVLIHKPLASRAGKPLEQTFTNLRGWRLLIWPAAPFLIYTVLLQPHFPNNNGLTKDWYAHATYFTMFLLGFWLAKSGGLWNELRRLRQVSLAVALFAYLFYLLTRIGANDESGIHEILPIWVFRNLYMWAALCTIFGWSFHLLNRPLRWLPWANEAVYPWYILHQSAIVLFGYWLIPLKLGAIAEPIVLTVGTVLACWALTSGLIQRVRWLRPLFGLKTVGHPHTA
ncbi:MAG: acyltransferase family protein [Burkholderiales bacterium]|nr:acyltransferase [Rhodocyclaceae bacterium]MCA3021653.1 acyltransferase [Rhodocyclaceae bacterium]MCA3051607.1 acyltransferase [Rhodocyclaceae bacterium]MCA3057479.1 acyltransferase [Rhodocyclaceae bacterium]